jgi:phosphatidylglycerophosphate synthase
MPEPLTAYSSDRPIYGILRRGVSYLYIEPNIITLFSMLVTVLLVDGVIQDRGFLQLTMLVNLRTVLDMLDGEMARYYEKTSQFGAAFDAAADIFYNFAVSGAFMYRYSHSCTIPQMVASCVLIGMSCENLYKELRVIIYKLDYEREHTPVTILIHDNYFIFNLLSFALLHSIL